MNIIERMAERTTRRVVSRSRSAAFVDMAAMVHPLVENDKGVFTV